MKLVRFVPGQLFLLFIPLVDLQSYGGALKCLACLLPSWFTFRDGCVSLNSALSELCCEHLMLIISDGSFRLSVRMPFTDFVDCSTCSRCPFAVKRVLAEDSNYKGLLEVIIER